MKKYLGFILVIFVFGFTPSEQKTGKINCESSELATSQIQSRLITADNLNFQYIGRWDFSNPSLPRAWTPGAYIVAKFSGDYCKIAIDDEIQYGSDYNYLEIVIDSTQNLRLHTTGTSNIFDISDNLTEGEHTLLICKSTEALMGYIGFRGLYLESDDALLTPDALPERKIECIGNSITCGSGNDISEIPCNSGSWFDNHNAYLSYGPATARALNAQWHLSSVSGIGLIHSCCDMTYTMPQVYGKYNLQTSGNDWDFSRYIPDVVTICLGQNDGVQDPATFCNAYISFIGEIRKHYPDAAIILLNSPMANDELNDALTAYTKSISTYLNDQGDANLYSFELSHNLNNGCTSHPDREEHKLVTRELIGFIKNTLNW